MKNLPAVKFRTIPGSDEYTLLFAATEAALEAAERANGAAAGVVTIEQNTQQELRFWVGTKDEYNAKEDSLPPNTFCIISDDKSGDDLMNAIADLATKVESMKGINLGITKIKNYESATVNHNIFEFDYFVVTLEGQYGRQVWRCDIDFSDEEDYSQLTAAAFKNNAKISLDFCKQSDGSFEVTYRYDLELNDLNTAYSKWDNAPPLAKIHAFKYPVKEDE